MMLFNHIVKKTHPNTKTCQLPRSSQICRLQPRLLGLQTLRHATKHFPPWIWSDPAARSRAHFAASATKAFFHQKKDLFQLRIIRTYLVGVQELKIKRMIILVAENKQEQPCKNALEIIVRLQSFNSTNTRSATLGPSTRLYTQPARNRGSRFQHQRRACFSYKLQQKTYLTY